MSYHHQDEILQAIIEGRFVPLRLVNGKLVPPPRSLRGLPPGITPEQAHLAYLQAQQQSPQERRATLERLRSTYAQLQPVSANNR